MDATLTKDGLCNGYFYVSTSGLWGLGIWSNSVLGVSVSVFLEEINI